MNKMRIALTCLAMATALSVGGVVLASSMPFPTIPWHVVSSGGALATASGVTLDGSIGQAIIGWSSSSGVTLHAGYWHALAPPGPTLYMPLVVK